MIADVQRLLDSSNLRSLSALKWKEITPKIFTQAKLEAVSNRRLRDVIAAMDIGDQGILYMLKLSVLTSIFNAGTTLHTLSLLPYMLPDVRTKPDSNKIIAYTEVHTCIKIDR